MILINKHNDRNAYISKEISFVVNERIFSIDGKGRKEVDEEIFDGLDPSNTQSQGKVN